jgi:ATP-dependent DNA ligase
VRSDPTYSALPAGWGLEGLVSKRRDRAYRGCRCAHWIKIKNPQSPAMKRVESEVW